MSRSDFKKSLKKFGAALASAALVLFSCLAVTAEPSFAAAAYTTDAFDVYVEVGSDGSYGVREHIRLSFNEERHGIYRYIPLEGEVKSYYGGKLYTERSKMDIEDVAVYGLDGSGRLTNEYEYEVYKDEDSAGNNCLVIQIGSSYSYVSGEKDYVICYKAYVYDDGISDFDQIYWNIIPRQWDTSIGGSRVEISLPAGFYESGIELISGGTSSAVRGLDSWTLENDENIAGNLIITAELTDIGYGDGLTFRAAAPEGYFSGERNNAWAGYGMAGVFVVTAALGLFLKAKYAKRPSVVSSVEFYPPEGLGPADLGYIIDGAVDTEDLTSLMVYFAGKGLLSIEEVSEENGLRKKERRRYRLNKLTDMPQSGFKSYEREFFRGLFTYGDTVYLDTLGDDFADSFITARELLIGSYGQGERRIFTSESAFAGFFAVILMILPFIATVALGSIWTNGEFTPFFMPSLVIVLITYVRSKRARDKRHLKKEGSFDAKGLIRAFLLALAAFLAFKASEICFEPRYGKTAAYAVLFGLVLSVGLLYYVALHMRSRTEYGARLLGKILGFKQFLETAEKDRLEALVAENPSYFFDILPYTYVLGVTDAWIGKFSDIKLSKPSWWISDSYPDAGGVYYSVMLCDMLGRANKTALTNLNKTLAANAADAAGGGFSGGGFSGGGHGGGGGGAW